MIITLAYIVLNVVQPNLTTQQQKEDPSFDWSEKKLTFNDFKAKPKTTKGVEGEFATKISWTITQETGKLPIYKVYNKMNPTESWMSVKHEELLKEYQFTWNLQELYARKARKDIEELNRRKSKDKDAYRKVITKHVAYFQKERLKYKGILQNQPDLYNILDKQYQDSIKMYSKYKLTYK